MEITWSQPCDSYQLHNRNPTINKHDNTTRARAPAFSIPDVQACPRKINEGFSLNPFGREVPDDKNGQLLLDHATECNLHITNTLFKKKNRKQQKFISDMNGCKSQINYILINKRWKNFVHNVEAYNSFSSLGSDHRLLTARIRLSLRTMIGLHYETQNCNIFTQ